MTDPDLQELADLWQEPDANTAEDIDRLGRRARRDAFLMGWADTAFAVIIVGSLIAGAMITPSAAVGVGAMLTIAMTFWVNWKRRSLRQITGTLGTLDRTAFLNSSIGLARAALRRVTLSLIFFPPLILATLLYRVARKGEMQHPLLAIAHWATSPRGMTALLLLGAVVIWMLRSRRRHLRELSRLEEIHRDYAEQAAQEQDLAD